MSIPNAGHAPATAPAGERAVAPIRWSRPTPANVALFLLWALGVAVATIPPALVVPPSRLDAPGSQLAAALGFTALGVLIMCVAGVLANRRTHEGGVLVAAVTPSIALFIGGLAMLGSKLFEVSPVR